MPQEKTKDERSQSIDDSYKDSGRKAWLVVVGGFINYFTTFGLLNTFGTFQTWYELNLLHEYSATTISWIGSIQLFLLFIGGMVIGPAFDKFGAIRLTIPGTILYVLAFMFTSLGTQYYQLLLAHGFLYGIANAMLFYPTISAINLWFDKKRGLALGIVVSGSSIGGIVWPIIIQLLLDNIGFQWTVRIAGFICLGLLCVSASLVVEPRDESAHGKHSIDAVTLRQQLLSKPYLLLTAGFTLVYLGMFIPFYYLPSYGIAHHLDSSMSNYLLAFLNAGSFLGRLISGFLADKLGALSITIFTSLLSSVMVLCLIRMTTEPTIITFAVLYGLFSGGLISLQSACTARITPNHNIMGIKIGVMMAVCSIGVLAGGPIGGALIDYYNGEYTGLILFSGFVMMAGSALFLLAQIITLRGNVD